MSAIDFSALLIESLRDPLVIAEIEQAIGRAIKRSLPENQPASRADS